MKANLIIGCDANARHTLWGSSEINERGESFFDFIIENNLAICNRGNTPTFVFPSSENYEGWEDVLDVTVANNNCNLLVENWRVSLLKSFSDHRWILFNLNFKTETPPPYRNPKRIDWKKFGQIVKSKLLNIPNLSPDSVEDLEAKVKTFEASMGTAFKVSCPIKYSRKTLPPWWNEDLSNLRKMTRTIFNICHKHKFYKPYKDCLRDYKRAIASAKRQGWREYCHSIENIKDSARLSKVLSKEHCCPSFLKKYDGTWTASPTESLEVLLSTHFPGCEDSSPEMRSTQIIQLARAENIDTLVTRESITWAINSFSPYKSPGLDGILPVMLQKLQDIAVPWLEKIFKGCLSLNHVPESWRHVRVVFIPKVGRRGHETAKDFRPISLTSFVLKTLERILDTHIRDILDRRPLSNSQHAYLKGKSTETALHEVVRTIEKTINYKEYTLATFLDVEGAFNNVLADSIFQSLVEFGVEDYIREWIISMLRNRKIQATLGNITSTKHVSRGTPQGGVLSPLLWLLVMNKILVKLETGGVKAVAYADDLVLLVSGKFTSVISEITEVALRKVSNWATSCGLGVNQSKTELMLFTTKTKVTPFTLPKLNGQTLTLSSSAKYLGVVLDPKLSWKLNIEERVKKSCVAFYACSKTFGKKWGLQSKMILWTYTAVVRPILTYGSIVWWPALNKAYNINKLKKVQRSASVGTTGALRTCPTDALSVFLHLLPLDLHIKYLVSCSAIRLNESNCWFAKPYGHSNITKLIPTEIFSTPTDYCTPTLRLSTDFKVKFPSRKEWEDDVVTRDFDTTIYTDGSKMECGVGSGIFSESLNIARSFRLPNFASVFQAEILAIREACKILKTIPNQNQNVAILTDSQAAVQAIAAASASSKLVQQCRDELESLNVNLSVTIIWVPGHCGIEGNERADELARQGSALHSSLEEQVYIPLGVMKGNLFSIFLTESNRRWSSLSNCVISRKIWPTYNKSRTKDLICRSRQDIARIVATCTGHWPIGEHAAKLGIPYNTHCRSCADQQEKETIVHFLCKCPALARYRVQSFGQAFYDDLNELSEMKIRDLISFLNATKWL